MKTLERINVKNGEIIIGYLDTETEIPDIENMKLIIRDLTQDEQNLTNDCLSILQSHITEGEIIVRSLMQITFNQHMCEERILCWSDLFDLETPENLGQYFFTYKNMLSEDKVKYDDFKAMCQSKLSELE